MRRAKATSSRPTRYEVKSCSNVYEQLRDYQDKRSVADNDSIARFKELVRLLQAKSTYINEMQASYGEYYRPNDHCITERVIGEHLCVIGDMPGWYFYDSSLVYDVNYAIGANGKIYKSTRIYDRDDFICIEDKLATYPADELAQFADAIEAYIARDALLVVDLLIKRMDRLMTREQS